MLKFNSLITKFQIVITSLISIITIGLLDFYTGSQLSFSIFYLIPISFLALQQNTSKLLVLTFSIGASFIWFFVEFNTNEYTHILIPIWNALVRLTIFISIGLLLFSYKQEQRKLHKLNGILKELNSEKDKFIGIAAHDIRNPISAIYSFSDLLLSDNQYSLNTKSTEFIGIIRSLSWNILELIKNLLDVSKIESGKIELTYKNQDYINFINNQTNTFQFLAQKKQITLKVKTSNESILADFDEHYMSEVINNLLSNAIKFSPNNSTIKINITKLENEILTEIVDNGQGIPIQEQQKLFNYFQKTSIKPTGGEQSTGLGLAIAKKIVTQMEGKIGVKSSTNEGSNFYYTFPIKRKTITEL